MDVSTMFPAARMRAGMYESFFLRAFSPREPIGVWLRYTVHKRPGRPPLGSTWCTVFDSRRASPFMYKQTSEQLEVPVGQWIGIAGQSSMGAGTAIGSCGPARWSLSFSTGEPQLRHLQPDWLYKAPLPRTKLSSPAPNASFHGSLEFPDGGPLELDGWLGAVGHNWGAEHAERWIWLHGAGFPEAPGAWLDVALGRLSVAGRMTPWVANGALSIDGRRHRIGGLARSRRPQVTETQTGGTLKLFGDAGLEIEASALAPAGSVAGWRYADPDGGEHDVLNCSIAALELKLGFAGAGERRTITTPNGGVYELGMRERDHGIAIADFPDG